MQEEGFLWGVRLWRTKRTIVLGISEKENQTIRNDTIQEFKNFLHNHSKPETDLFIPSKIFPELHSAFIARRASGGGTVYHDHPANMNFSIFVDISSNQELYPIKNSYDVLLGMVRKALAEQGVTAHTAGKSDISVVSESGVWKKISGNAQFRKKNVIVQHGTLILDESIFDSIEKFQLHPPEEPEYRKKRSHREFLTSVARKIDETQFAHSLQSQLANYLKREELFHKKPESKIQKKFIQSSLKRAYKLRNNKYALKSWIFKN